MRKLVYCIIVVMAVILCHAQKTNKDSLKYYNTYVRDVVIKDSVFMDEIISFISNDSILAELQSHFLPGLDFDYFLESPNSIEIISSKRRNLMEIRDKNDTIFEDLLDDCIRNIINQDSCIQIILILKRYIDDKYKTAYKGKTFYFDEKIRLNDKRLFRITKQGTSVKVDIGKAIDGWNLNIWIPLIYDNHHLYIDPDTLQWFILRE